jgi:hypothetical protein
MRERVERELSAGAPQRIVARRAGIGERTLRRWVADGRIGRPERPAPADDWQIAAQLLEDLFPERWAAEAVPAGLRDEIDEARLRPPADRATARSLEGAEAVQGGDPPSRGP